MIIDRGEAEVDNHFLRVNILTISLSGMNYLFIIPKLLSAFVQTKSTSLWPNVQKFGNDVALFWCNVIMSYLTFMITECQTAQAVQIWFQTVLFNMLKKTCDKIRVLIVSLLK